MIAITSLGDRRRCLASACAGGVKYPLYQRSGVLTAYNNPCILVVRKRVVDEQIRLHMARIARATKSLACIEERLVAKSWRQFISNIRVMRVKVLRACPYYGWSDRRIM